MEDLESYVKQVEEFATFGNISELSKYLKKANALNSKLDSLIEKVLTLDTISVAFDEFENEYETK